MVETQSQHQVPAVSDPNGAVAAAGSLSMVSLYVGDLDLSVTDAQLYDLFSQVGSVVSVRVCRDVDTGRSLGYGYVNFSNRDHAAKALDILNFTPLNDQQIRIMYSYRDPSLRKSGTGNIFIKNLDKSIDNKALHETFSSFGNILSCKVATDSSGESRGYGFVQFDSEESAQNAIDKLNGMLINDKQVFVGHFRPKNVRENTSDGAGFNNVFVKNLSESTTDEDLKKVFGEYGTIISAVVVRDGDGKSKCFGFVNFENADDAAHAVEALSGKKFDDKEWYVGKAKKKSEREQELKEKFDQGSMKLAADRFPGANLYVKNLDDSIGEEKLRELFSEFGAVTSCKVMRGPSGISRGAGFVAFSTVEEASRALVAMNGKLLFGKPLYVALAQRKEERRAQLQAQFSHMRPLPVPSSARPRMPIYSTAPGLGQQFLYRQAPPMIPQQVGFGYHQQLVRGMRPGGAQRPNLFVPFIQQGHYGQRPGASPVHQMQLRVPLMQQQVLPRGRGYGFQPGHNASEAPVAGFAGNVISPLDSALATKTPEQQKTLLGESLYQLVEQIERGSAAKVTGMLLEMDQREILHLLESPAALKAKVAEAMEVLRRIESSTPADQLASLSLNEY